MLPLELSMRCIILLNTLEEHSGAGMFYVDYLLKCMYIMLPQEGFSMAATINDLIDDFIQKIRKGDIEIYNEFSLQHELGFFLRNNTKAKDYNVPGKLDH